MRVVGTTSIALLSSIYLLLLRFIPISQAYSVGHLTPMRRSWGSQATELRSQRTLASDYVIDVSESYWRAHRIDHVAAKTAPEGERAVAALQTELFDAVVPSFTLTAMVQDETVKITLEDPTALDIDEALISIISRIMVQWAVDKQGSLSKLVSIQLPNEDSITTENLLTKDGVLALFQPLIGSIDNVELSEMVDQNGEPLGMVPRKLVHKVNLLHRGIGMVVTKDQSILRPGCTNFPDLYTHRRTDSKRIFPSLYDMFVGGVSTAKEDPKTTAAREVAEELGLERALSDPTMLSGPLFDCTVCTSYNRCVVTVFCCSFDSTKDTVAWQKEEVAWGDFVSYDTIVTSADLSIQRLIEKNAWPGTIPIDMEKRLTESKEYERGDHASKNWDYVPDGLLVWEAWLEWQKG